MASRRPRVRLADLHHNRSKARRIRAGKHNKAPAASRPETFQLEKTRYSYRVRWPQKSNRRAGWMVGDEQRRLEAASLALQLAKAVAS